ncbi:YeeE/YedE thiosulfate transporter family protein [Entomospira entomophila]|uniref:YeeE/YedE family protein n=1 Tax=Entomospira entomophila TaxID=2719988 RepID=A0A968GDF6_9SPIO|nr:YeeE/YedE thiosulfate transporter family protein [Entomospira entomophilus]NIZ40974.1 YeeE/YedE family protein [Entomospira entomophilus]WDI35187.1 YeeE/YedE thiosulfate transporter family protein [Entomospira entomophilus]
MSTNQAEASTSSGITRKKRPAKKPKKSQIPLGILLIIGIFAIGYVFYNQSPKLAIFWFFGLAFGYILQRSRFCFTASFRDPCISGGTTITRAVLVAIALTSIGFAGIKIGAEGALDMAGVNPIGLPMMIGGVLFGIGMVIAGGCASGTVMRVGEGFIMQMLSLFFFVLGSLWGAHDMGAFWNKFNENAPRIYLPNAVGWVWAIIIQLGIIIMIYMAAVKWQEKKLGSRD